MTQRARTAIMMTALVLVGVLAVAALILGLVMSPGEGTSCG